MSKYFGSPWGYMRGKLFDTVGGYWKGINWNRVRVFPKQRGTLDNYRLLKDGLLDPWEFSYPQMNIRRAIIQVLGYIARMNMEKWIVPVWDALVAKRGWTMTGTNAFVRRNAATLLNSMEKGKEFIPDPLDPDYNIPNLADMLVSDGDLEGPAELTSATYDTVTGAVTYTWDPTIFTNGAGDDRAYLMVAKKPILESVGRDGTWAPKLFMYSNVYTEPFLVNARSAGTATLTIPMGLNFEDLTAYLFFRDEQDIIGHSPSKGIQATEATP